MRRIPIALLYIDEHDAEKWKGVLQSQDNIELTLIDISRSDWLEQCSRVNYAVFIMRPPGLVERTKALFDERAQLLTKRYDAIFYPSLLECLLYENKKYLAYWLKAQEIPSPPTWVFYNRAEALQWVQESRYPFVGKVNIGASGKGVSIIDNPAQAKRYVDTAFTVGLKPRVGPNFKHSSIWKKLKNALRNKKLVKRRLTTYKAVLAESQKYCIFQEFISHQFEWRVVVIGDSYFAHKKMVYKQMASGSLLKDYSDPPLKLLDFARDICIKNSFLSVSLDILESADGYLVNEIQCYFGQSDSFQMKVNGVVGRYVYKGGWVFEAGDFARNQCYNLRLEHIIRLHHQKLETLQQ